MMGNVRSEPCAILGVCYNQINQERGGDNVLSHLSDTLAVVVVDLAAGSASGANGGAAVANAAAEREKKRWWLAMIRANGSAGTYH
jgi:hypothetical protein